jgi:uroporphyrinogen decarboxylase
MDSRSRVESALKHREPDRVPFDLGGTETSGIHRIALKNWLSFNGFPESEPRICSLATQSGAVEEEVVHRFGIDVRCLRVRQPAAASVQVRKEGDSSVFQDEWGIRWRMPLDGGLYYDICSHPLAGFSTVQEIERYRWPDTAEPSRYAGLKQDARALTTSGRPALVLERHTGGIFETSWWQRGLENLLVDMASDSRLAEALLHKMLEHKLLYWEKALEQVGDQILVAAEADDLATQSGLLMSKGMYRKYLKPLHRQLFAFIKGKAPAVKLFYHSCGAVAELIPDLLEAGVDILNPIQVSAAGMDTRKLKREYGKDLVFWGGGVDTQRVLPYGTPEQVHDEVKRRIEDLAPGGGFVFSAVHCIQSDVPPQNIQAMWEALREYGAY